MKPLAATIDLDEEVQHIVEFITQKWGAIESLSAIVPAIRDEALHAARAWVDSHAIWEVATTFADRREMVLESVWANAYYYDAYWGFANEVSRHIRTYRDAALNLDGRWDYERRVRVLSWKLQEAYPSLTSARPLGWEEIVGGYTDFAGQESYHPGADQALFGGSRVTHVMAPSLPAQVALPYVMYDEVCQGRKACTVLVGAIYSHFLGIAEFLTTHAVIQALDQVLTDRVLTLPEVRFSFDLAIANPVLLVLRQFMPPFPTREAHDKAYARHQAWLAMSEAEREALTSNRDATIKRILSELRQRDAAADEAQRQALEAQWHTTITEQFQGATSATNRDCTNSNPLVSD